MVLSSFEAKLKGEYRWYWRLLDARWFGLPQRRVRLYIVIQRVDRVLQSISGEFVWPCPTRQPMTLAKYIKSTDQQRHFRRRRAAGVEYGGDHSVSERRQLRRVLRKAKVKGEMRAKLIVDLKTTRCCNYGVDIAPTITASAASSLAFYHCGLKRRLSTEELAIAQGFALQHCAFDGLRRRQSGRLIGNAMASPVLCQILRNAVRNLRL